MLILVSKKKRTKFNSSNELKCVPFEYNDKFVALPREQL